MEFRAQATPSLPLGRFKDEDQSLVAACKPGLVLPCLSDMTPPRTPVQALHRSKSDCFTLPARLSDRSASCGVAIGGTNLLPAFRRSSSDAIAKCSLKDDLHVCRMDHQRRRHSIGQRLMGVGARFLNFLHVSHSVSEKRSDRTFPVSIDSTVSTVDAADSTKEDRERCQKHSCDSSFASDSTREGTGCSDDGKSEICDDSVCLDSCDKNVLRTSIIAFLKNPDFDKEFQNLLDNGVERENNTKRVRTSEAGHLHRFLGSSGVCLSEAWCQEMCTNSKYPLSSQAFLVDLKRALRKLALEDSDWDHACPLSFHQFFQLSHDRTHVALG